MKRFVLIGMMAAAMAVVGTPRAEAAPITGQLDFVSRATFVFGATGNAATIGTATGLDFLTIGGGNSTPGVAGGFLVIGATGSFATAGMTPGSTVGTIRDFTFSGAGSANFPNPPVTGFQATVAPIFAFNMSNVFSIVQTGNFLGILASGTMTLAGFDPTTGVFAFSTQDPTGQQGTFSFSATDVAVPEPGSMVLLGTGLLGLAAAARRMRKA